MESNFRNRKISDTIRSRMEEKSIVIFVATHVKCNPPAIPIYVPLHVGREGKDDLGYVGDNIGKNISALNHLYGELTGLYWISQNIQGMDYIGLCHYRRYFINEQKYPLNRQEYLSILQDHDIIVPVHQQCDGSYYDYFCQFHNGKDLDAVGRALKKLYPDYADSYDQAMSGQRFFYGNLMVTGIDILKDYADWLFRIFAEASSEIDVSGYDAYHKRVYGFLSEQMLLTYILKNGLSCFEAPVGLSEQKAETAMLIRQLKDLLDLGKREEAKSLLTDTLKKRPDLLAENADTEGSLKKLLQSLR